LLFRSKLMDELHQLKPREATKEEIEYVHKTSYIDKVKELSDTTGGDAGDHAIVCRGSYEIASLSIGGAIRAVDAVMENEVDNVYALTRPPGHHTEADFSIGFCIFIHVATATKHTHK